MVNRKAQNSLLVLTTLGVYLGLLMVGGAAPQVLAHSATTRVFEITDEIEVKDDLDNKPHPDGSCESLLGKVQELERKALWFNRRSVGEYVGALESIFDAYPVKSVEWLDLTWTTQDASRPFRVANPPSRYLAPVEIDAETRKDIDGRVWELVNGFHAATGYEYTVNRNAVETKATLTLNFTGVDPETFHSAYAAGFDWARCDSPGLYFPDFNKAAYSNSKLFVKNNVLVIVTRLPRAGLDPLLAKDAK